MNLKKLSLLILFSLFILIGCKKNDAPKTTSESQVKPTKNNPFIGTWSRSFSMGQDVTAQVTYDFHKDSVVYNMAGPMNLKYTLKSDQFIAKDNRWIVKKDSIPYVIFAKNITDKSITLLKMKLKNKEEGLTMKFPADSARSKFSSWNVYLKK
ncbi:MAG: hypothetical protein V3U80_00945 [Flavobacteriaceae bacterium]